jgi:GT2 family glycosyltransferase
MIQPSRDNVGASLRARIALAVVTRDRADLLSRCLLPTLRKLTACGFTVLVVDQSAGDDSERLARETPGLDYMRSGPGVSRGRNAAVQATASPLLAFVDDDVTPTPHWLARIVEIFDGAPNVGVVCGRAVNSSGKLLPGSDAGIYRWPTSPFQLGSGFNLSFRREALEDAGLFDEQLGAGANFKAGEDTDMVYRIMRKGWCVACADEITVVHHDLRTGLDAFRLHYGYGVGAGGQTARLLAEGDRIAFRIAVKEVGKHFVTLLRAILMLQPQVAGFQVAYVTGLVKGFLLRRQLLRKAERLED